MRPTTALAAACLFASGAAALVYEVLWIRESALVFGSSTFALGTVLGVFFLGLAAGSEAFGRWASRWAAPLRVFAWLELGLAAWGLASPHFFGWVEAALGPLHRSLVDSPALLRGARILLVAAVVFPPTVLMGGTLPLFCRRFVLRDARIAAPVGWLYGVNTLGAAVGCLAAGYAFLPRLGVPGALGVAAALNVLAAVTAWRLDGSADRPRAETRASADEGGGRAPRTTGRIGAFFFLVGFTALGHEVLWARFLSLIVRNSVHTSTLTLGIVLAGIVLGSWLAASFADELRGRARLFGGLQIVAALLVLAVFHLPPELWRGWGQASVLFLLAPAALSGASFPLAVRIAVADPAQAGFGVGRLVALNAVGGIVGSLAVAFVGLPHFGLQSSLQALTGLGILAGLGAWLLLGGGAQRGLVVSGVLACGVWFALPRALGTRLPDQHLIDPGDTLVTRIEGLAGNLAVLRRAGVTSLEIDRWWQGEDRRNHQSVAAFVPLFLHPEAESVLVVGVGAGQTPAGFLAGAGSDADTGVEQLDAVDVEPAVFEVIREHFGGEWLDDPRVSVIADDGRHHVLHTRAEYDIVSLELGQVFLSGVAACYSLEFYERVRRCLAPGGIVCQFVPTAFLEPALFRRVVETFRTVFPQSLLWYNTSELLLLGTVGGGFRLAPERLDALDAGGPWHKDLAYAHWGGPDEYLHHPAVFLAGLLAGPRELAVIGAEVEPLEDDHPALEYAAARVPAEAEFERDLVELLGPRLADVEATLGLTLEPAQRERLAEVRAANLADMVAAAILRRADGLVARGAYAELVALAEEALAVHAGSAEARRRRGEALLALGRFAEAESELAAAVGGRPTDPLARRGLAFALHRLDRVREALVHYEAAAARLPLDAELQNNLGSALAQLGDVEAASERFRAALRLDPDHADARRNLQQAEAVLRQP